MVPTDRDDEVLTPGGPRPRSMVRSVRYGESVDVNRGVHVMAADLVLTPGGFRDRSLVHQIQTGRALVATQEHFLQLDRATNQVDLVLERLLLHGQVPTLGSGWIAYAYWSNGTGTTFRRFTSKWKVPPSPSSSADPLQTIFLFNGIQNTGTNFGILQPVLQWGTSAAGGGPSWSIASWYVTSGGQAFHTQLVPVSEGDVLTGTMTLVSSDGIHFNYLSEFEGVAATKLPVQNIAELTWFNETLEAYAIVDCSDYPNTTSTPFSDIVLDSAAGPLPLAWTSVSQISDCGQHAVSSAPSEVDIIYRALSS